jgi:hypothetical protein
MKFARSYIIQLAVQICQDFFPFGDNRTPEGRDCGSADINNKDSIHSSLGLVKKNVKPNLVKRLRIGSEEIWRKAMSKDSSMQDLLPNSPPLTTATAGRSFGIV